MVLFRLSGSYYAWRKEEKGLEKDMGHGQEVKFIKRLLEGGSGKSFLKHLPYCFFTAAHRTTQNAGKPNYVSFVVGWNTKTYFNDTAAAAILVVIIKYL